MNTPQLPPKTISTWTLFLISAVCGLMSAFSTAPYHHWPLLMIGLATLSVIQFKLQKHWHGFISGWLFGFFYFTFSLSWIGNALLVDGNDYAWAWPLAVTGLPALLAFFTAFACYIGKKILQPNPLYFFFGLATLISLSELARGYIFTGFPWNLYGYTWGNNLALIQILHIGNVYWLSAITVFWAAGLGYIIAIRQQRRNVFTALMLILISFASIQGYGYWRLQSAQLTNSDTITIRIVQPNIAQADKWKRDKMNTHFSTLLDLSKPDGNETQTTLIVWPETATNFLFLNNEFALSQIRDTLDLYDNNVYLVTGALLRNKEDLPSNSLLVLNKSAEIIHRYNKSHLVPFGEYIPFQDWIPIETVSGFSGFQRGDGPEVINIEDNFSFSPLVCYEILFPGNVVPDGKKPDAIINVTNDGWYGISAGPYQHYLKARYRAIEEGIPVIRSANTGVSGFFDSFGREIVHLELSQRGYKALSMPTQ